MTTPGRAAVRCNAGSAARPSSGSRQSQSAAAPLFPSWRTGAWTIFPAASAHCPRAKSQRLSNSSNHSISSSWLLDLLEGRRATRLFQRRIKIQTVEHDLVIRQRDGDEDLRVRDQEDPLV